MGNEEFGVGRFFGAARMGLLGGGGSAYDKNGSVSGGLDLHLDLYRATSAEPPGFIFGGALDGYGISGDYSLQWDGRGLVHQAGLSFHRFWIEGLFDFHGGPAFLSLPPLEGGPHRYGVALEGGMLLRAGQMAWQDKVQRQVGFYFDLTAAGGALQGDKQWRPLGQIHLAAGAHFGWL